MRPYSTSLFVSDCHTHRERSQAVCTSWWQRLIIGTAHGVYALSPFRQVDCFSIAATSTIPISSISNNNNTITHMR